MKLNANIDVNEPIGIWNQIAFLCTSYSLVLWFLLRVTLYLERVVRLKVGDTQTKVSFFSVIKLAYPSQIIYFRHSKDG